MNADPEITRPLGTILARHSAVESARLFGSRAKGTAQPASDIDVVLLGDLTPLATAAIADELDELPLPYRFDVKAYAHIKLPALRDHIDRVGVEIYRRDG